MSDGATQNREKKGKEEGSFTGDELLQRRRRQGGDAGREWCSGAGERACGSEREEAREMAGFYTIIERGKGKRKGASGRRPCH
jgi:hypothetical protein